MWSAGVCWSWQHNFLPCLLWKLYFSFVCTLNGAFLNWEFSHIQTWKQCENQFDKKHKFMLWNCEKAREKAKEGDKRRNTLQHITECFHKILFNLSRALSLSDLLQKCFFKNRIDRKFCVGFQREIAMRERIVAAPMWHFDRSFLSLAKRRRFFFSSLILIPLLKTYNDGKRKSSNNEIFAKAFTFPS